MAFIVVVLTVAVATSVTSILMEIQAVVARTYDQLETSVSLKARLIEAWVDRLVFALDSLIVDGYELESARALLGVEPVPTGGATEDDHLEAG